MRESNMHRFLHGTEKSYHATKWSATLWAILFHFLLLVSFIDQYKYCLVKVFVQH